MASFAPLHTGQFIIKPRALHQRRSARVGVLLLLILVPYGTFELGRFLGGYSIVNSRLEHLQQSTQIDSLNEEIGKLRRELSSAHMGRKVDQQSTDSVQQSFAGLQATIQKQQEELSFYKAIVSPDVQAPVAPQVQRIEVQLDGVANRYRMQLVLIQPMALNGNAQGSLQVLVKGMRAGQSVSLPLKDLLVDKGDTSLKFSYRYFQTLDQLIDLPADFQPQSVQIELRATQHPVQLQEFAWQPHVRAVS
jgi:hypothetical protein